MSVFESESGLGPALEPVAATIAKGSGQISCVEQLVDEFADYGERYYANAWAACSDWERITLRDLASGAFLIAPVRAELRELARKRLLVPTRGCALASEGFRRYILGAIDPRAAVRLRTPESGAWTAIPRIAGAFLGGITLIVIVALIFGQRETLQSFVAYLTAALGGVGTLARFLAGSKRASESEDTHA
jgi:hypothetical protein